MSDTERPRAREVSVFTKRRLLAIAWSDGHESVYDWEALRWKCPCAHCSGELGSPGVLEFTESLTPEQTTLVDLHQVGHYALQPVWQDGHDSGLFSLGMLRGLCPCPSCQGAA